MNYFNTAADIEALVSRLIDKLDASRTESLELSVGDVHLKLDRHSAPAPHPPVMMPPPLRMPSVPASPISEEDDVVLPPKEPAPAVSAATINAPLLGVAYAAPAPDAAPFVKVGDSVKKGDIVCIIEAMKVMNEIEADRDGVVAEILFENGKMVEFGQPLIAIR